MEKYGNMEKSGNCNIMKKLTKNIVFFVPKGATSKAVGHKRRNINRIEDKYFVKKHIKSVKVLEKNGLLGYNIKIEF